MTKKISFAVFRNLKTGRMYARRTRSKDTQDMEFLGVIEGSGETTVKARADAIKKAKNGS